jgi:hypothetical protein
VKLVLEAQSAAVVLVHNHPSQNDRFSSADEQITHRLKSALDLIDVRVVDLLVDFSVSPQQRKMHQSLGFLGINLHQRIQEAGGDTFARFVG